ncbi:unnamed protein product [Schistosoma margrebowiei]|uniref:NADH dehydrogenase [ubiquinone] 1 alpha subcomplex subunit 1 n=1 Tax=Schistosoma margrebowiei TaxID=48269 RepID=A0AA85AJ97_9TREM|nr:unnamed protein product [Schistosoma margrebowiei]
MWYEILPALSIVTGITFAIPPLLSVTNYAFFGRWSPPNLFEFKQDFFLHLRDKDLEGPLLFQDSEFIFKD